MAEYFRDDEHRDVLLLIDNIFRFIQAGMEVSGLLGEMLQGSATSRPWYRSIGPRRTHCQYHAGAITSIQAVYVPADDLTDLPRTCLLSPFRIHCAFAQRASEDFIRDRSSPVQLENGHACIVATALQPRAGDSPHSAQYESLKTLWPCWEWSSFPSEIKRRCKGTPAGTLPDAALLHYRAIQRNERKACKPEGLAGCCERILHDEFKDYPESALYMIGAIGEARSRGRSARSEEARYETARSKEGN